MTTRLLSLVLAAVAAALAGGCSGGAGRGTAPADPAPVDSVAFSPDGAALAFGSGTVVKVFNVADGAVRHTLTVPHQVPALAFSPDGKQLAGACADKTVLIWDVGSGQVGRTFSGLKAPPTSMAWSRTGVLVVGCGDPNPYADRRGNVRSELRVYEPAGAGDGAELADPGDTPTGVAFLPDGTKFVTGAADGTVRLWDAASRKHAGPSVNHGSGIAAVAVSPDARLLVTTGQDNSVVVWELAPLKQRAKLEGLADRANRVAFSAIGPVTAGEDGALWAWDTDAKAPRHKLLDKGARLYALATPDGGHLIAAGGVGGGVRVWTAAAPGDRPREFR